MWYVYVLYSYSGKRTYVGYSNDVERRLFEHNVSEKKGFTLRYRPWVLIHQESFENKQEAMMREKFLKTGRGRLELQKFVENYVSGTS